MRGYSFKYDNKFRCNVSASYLPVPISVIVEGRDSYDAAQTAVLAICKTLRKGDYKALAQQRETFTVEVGAGVLAGTKVIICAARTHTVFLSLGPGGAQTSL